MVRPVLPLFDYIVNQDYISEFLCINKDKVALECNGKCYLMQRLQEQNNEKHENLPRIAMEKYPIGFVELLTFSTKVTMKIDAAECNGYLNNYDYLFSYTNYHPPSTLV